MSEPASQAETRTLLRRLLGFLALLAVIWLVLYWLWIAFPYIRNGSDLTILAKRERLIESNLFDGDDDRPVKLLVFGDSRALCAFVPETFDLLSQGSVASWNLGMPGRREFLDLLEQALAAGNRPTHVFLLVPWNTEPEFQPTLFHWFQSDRKIVDALFPFRDLPRDVVVFALNARKHGGLSAFYQYSRHSIDQMIADRGYYFIVGSARFPDHRLPPEFTMWIDEVHDTYWWHLNVRDEKNVHARDVVATGPQFERLRQIANEYGIRFVFIPTYARVTHADRPPPINESTVRALAPYDPEFSVVGPDYIIYPNRYFSDEVHLNEEGADVYTRDLWDITRSALGL